MLLPLGQLRLQTRCRCQSQFRPPCLLQYARIGVVVPAVLTHLRYHCRRCRCRCCRRVVVFVVVVIVAVVASVVIVVVVIVVIVAVALSSSSLSLLSSLSSTRRRGHCRRPNPSATVPEVELISLECFADGHGTHVARIAAGSTDNSEGIGGISNSSLLSGRALSESGSGSTSDIQTAINPADGIAPTVVESPLEGGVIIHRRDTVDAVEGVLDRDLSSRSHQCRRYTSDGDRSLLQLVLVERQHGVRDSVVIEFEPRYRVTRYPLRRIDGCSLDSRLLILEHRLFDSTAQDAIGESLLSETDRPCPSSTVTRMKP
ncbi:hypothetical protein C9J85_05300 [Haloferax sp. wsp5]|nr:hypothetical protein C9J85_05300 [Haloferax sp. wsp5]